MQQITKLILVISLIFNVILIICISNRKVPDYSKRIDSLESGLSSIKDRRDSIKGRIDTTIIKIKENDRYYKEVINNIQSNTVTDDYVFFCNYLQRFDSINNSTAVKEN